jgi:hypothetical protein
MKIIYLAIALTLESLVSAIAMTPAQEWRMGMAACLNQLPYPTSQWMEQHELRQCRHATEWLMHQEHRPVPHGK